MTEIKCPKCKKALLIDIAKAVDEYGEIFRCPNCSYLIRYDSNQ